MKLQIEVLRHPAGSKDAHFQTFVYETDDLTETVATVLTRLNERAPLRDEQGNQSSPIRWECSCLQKKCGACAMVINGCPRLACGTRLSGLGKKIRLEPLKKFPVVEDLMVDRNILRENLKTMKLWFEEDAVQDREGSPEAYDASRCLQCGCCLEVCPNFYAGGSFTGMAAAVPTARLLSELPEVQKKEIYRIYRRRIYEGCGKSLACHAICPAGIDIEKLLVRSNAATIWKRKRK